MKKNFNLILLLIMFFGIIYFVLQNKINTNNDLKLNQEKIDSLQKENQLYKQSLDSLNNITLKYKEDISLFTNKIDSLNSINDSLKTELKKRKSNKPYKPKTGDEIFDYLNNYKPIF